MKSAAVAGIGAAALGAIAYNYQSGEDTELFMSHRMRQADYDYMRYVSEQGKSYGTKAEYMFRQKIFEAKDKELKSIMAENTTFEVEHNKFSDWTAEEYKKLLGYKPEQKTDLEAPLFDETNVAADVDWRTKGGVTKVKNQGQCGSCWAFSSTGAIEGARFVSTSTLTSLSEQQLCDCSKKNHGCQGGLMEYAFEYAVQNPLETESDYPYISEGGRKEACKYERSRGVGKVVGYKDVSRDSASQLKAAIEKAPVSVAVEADKSVFQHYKTGILDSRACGKKLDHGVLAVGYGEGYFIVKNSWGGSWGDQGYLKISDSAENICGILSQPTYPTE